MASSERLRVGTKLAYGIGGSAEAAPYIAFNTFNMLFYNQVLGLSGSLCGLAVTIALVFDAIADPIIGFWSDRLRSRLGRRHPFMFAAPIPLALSFFLLYAPPEGLSGYGLFAWLTFFTLAYRQALSLYHVPHLALGAELTTSYHERTTVMSYQALFQLVGGASTAWIGWTVIEKAGGTQDAAGYTLLGAGIALIAALIIFSSAWFTRDQIPRMKPPPASPGKADVKALFVAMTHCLKNRNYRMLLIGLLCLSATIGVRETLSSYTGLFFWELGALQLRNFALASPPAYFLAFIFIARLHRKLDKRTTIIGSMLLVIFSVATPMLFRLLDLLPANGSPRLMPVLMAYHFVFYLGFSTLSISVLSALADVADEHELETGVRQEGMFYAARTFFGQLSSALGHLIAGIVLDLIAFPKGAAPGQVSQDVLTSLALFEGPLAALPALVAIAFYARFHISRKRLDEIQSELARRHAAAGESAPVSDSPPPPVPAANEIIVTGA